MQTFHGQDVGLPSGAQHLAASVAETLACSGDPQSATVAGWDSAIVFGRMSDISFRKHAGWRISALPCRHKGRTLRPPPPPPW